MANSTMTEQLILDFEFMDYAGNTIMRERQYVIISNRDRAISHPII